VFFVLAAVFYLKNTWRSNYLKSFQSFSGIMYIANILS
jgi:uncharacterized protein (DUF486 family)